MKTSTAIQSYISSRGNIKGKKTSNIENLPKREITSPFSHQKHKLQVPLDGKQRHMIKVEN